MRNDDIRQVDTSHDRLIYSYVNAVEDGDMEKVSEILDIALTNPELEQAVNEINLTYQEEEIDYKKTDAEFIRELLRKHLPSAFERNIIKNDALTLSDVARKLKNSSQVLSKDQAALEILCESSVQLPKVLGLPKIKQLALNINVEASDRFWQLFRQKAIFMRMGRSHEKVKDQTQLAAAREAVAKRNAKKKRNPHS